LPHVCTVDTGRIGDEIAIFVLFPETKLSIKVLIRNDLVLILVVKYIIREISLTEPLKNVETVDLALEESLDGIFHGIL
jgi:hypothetical protein